MSYAHLTLQERYVIYHLVLYGLSYREIGRRLNRHYTTIRREVQLNGPRYTDDGVYANQRKYKARHCHRRSNLQLVRCVQNKIRGNNVLNLIQDMLFNLHAHAEKITNRCSLSLASCVYIR
jgi:IS30 family transposase